MNVSHPKEWNDPKTTVQYPDRFKRTPGYPDYDGEITIQVIP